MTLFQLVADAIELADKHAPNGETVEQAKERRAIYALNAIAEATGISQLELEAIANPGYELDVPEPRRHPPPETKVWR